MPTCPACGQESPDGFRFCGSCGAALAPAAAPREVRKTVTVVFCDVTGSTALGERLDPEAMRRTMGRYFEEIRLIVERHGGTVEKFIGDAAMAVFGIPVAHEDDALRAVRAVAEIRERLTALGDELSVALSFRTGVNTGEVVAGEGETLVTGDAVNVAARLEQAAPTGEILIGAATLSLVRDAVTVEAVDPLELKGKREPVAAFRLVAVDATADAFTRHLDAPLVGRVREQQRLRAAFEDVVSERECHMFTLLGPAGVGKSRLTEEFLTRRRRDRRRAAQPLPPLRRGHHLLAARRDPARDRRRPGRRDRQLAGRHAARLSQADRGARGGAAADPRARRHPVGRARLPRPDRARLRLVA